jgi:hypothetical protein
MARTELDREDLLREATALVDRVELRVVGEPEPLTIGFRKGGSLSVYFGGDPVYQFNSAGELRRAFVGGLLYKADRGRLVALRRERHAHEVVLQRIELSRVESSGILEAMEGRLQRLRRAIEEQTYELLGQVSTTADVLGRVTTWLAMKEHPIVVASRPNV